MKKMNYKHSIIAVVMGSMVLSGAALAQESLMEKTEQAVNVAGEKVDNSMKKVDAFMDDSAITARVKAALLENKQINSTDISVSTERGVVTLSGFINDAKTGAQAVLTASQVDGVKSVSDQLNVKESKGSSIGGFVSDTAITSEAKAKLLAESGIPSGSISVETSEGIVQLSGNVERAEQVTKAEAVVKGIEGVKSVKNDLKVKVQ